MNRKNKRQIYSGSLRNGCTVLPPGKARHSRSPLCNGCPYSRNGITCWSGDGSCLRTDMQEIEARHRRRKEALPSTGGRIDEHS